MGGWTSVLICSFQTISILSFFSIFSVAFTLGCNIFLWAILRPVVFTYSAICPYSFHVSQLCLQLILERLLWFPYQNQTCQSFRIHRKMPEKLIDSQNLKFADHTQYLIRIWPIWSKNIEFTRPMWSNTMHYLIWVLRLSQLHWCPFFWGGGKKLEFPLNDKPSPTRPGSTYPLFNFTRVRFSRI